MTMLSATATVPTQKASRYLKALCNHFNQKVTAEYDENRGTVDFGFGHCQMDADEATLVIHIQAENKDDFARVKYVVSDHLERFSGNEALQTSWQAGTSTGTPETKITDN